MASDIDGAPPPGGNAPPGAPPGGRRPLRPRSFGLQNPPRGPAESAPPSANRPRRDKAATATTAHKPLRRAEPLSAANAEQLAEHRADGAASAPLQQSLSGASAKYLGNPYALSAEAIRNVATLASAAAGDQRTIYLPGPSSEVRPIEAAKAREFVERSALASLLSGGFPLAAKDAAAAFAAAADGSPIGEPLSQGALEGLRRYLAPQSRREKAAFKNLIGQVNALLTGQAGDAGAANGPPSGQANKPARAVSFSLGQAAALSRAAGQGRDVGAHSPPLAGGGSLPPSPPPAGARALPTVSAAVAPSIAAAATLNAAVLAATAEPPDSAEPPLDRAASQAAGDSPPSANLGWDAWAALLQRYKAKNALLYLAMRQEMAALVAAAAIAGRKIALAASEHEQLSNQIDAGMTLMTAAKQLQLDLLNINGANIDAGSRQTPDQRALDIFPPSSSRIDSRNRKVALFHLRDHIEEAQKTVPGLQVNDLLKKTAPADQGATPHFLPTLLSDHEIELLTGHNPALAKSVRAEQDNIEQLSTNAVGNRYNTLAHEQFLRERLARHFRSVEQNPRTSAADRIQAKEQADHLELSARQFRAARSNSGYLDIVTHQNREDMYVNSLARLHSLRDEADALAGEWHQISQSSGVSVSQGSGHAAKAARERIAKAEVALLDELQQMLAMQAPLMLNTHSAIDNRTGRQHSGDQHYRDTVANIWRLKSSGNPSEAARGKLLEEQVRLSSTCSAYAAASLSYHYEQLRTGNVGPKRPMTAEEIGNYLRQDPELSALLAQTSKAQLKRHIYDMGHVKVPGIFGIAGRPAKGTDGELARDKQEDHFWQTFQAVAGDGRATHPVEIASALRKQDDKERGFKEAYYQQIGIKGGDADSTRDHLDRIVQGQLPEGLGALNNRERIEHALELYRARAACLNKDVMHDRTYERIEQLSRVFNNWSAADLAQSTLGDVKQTAAEAGSEFEAAFSELVQQMSEDLDRINALQRQLNKVYEIAT